MAKNIFAPFLWYLLLVFLCVALCAPATMVEAATISGTVVAVDPDTDQDMPIPGARIFLLDDEDNIIANGVCSGAGNFNLEVPDDAKVQPFLQGPVESEAFINTYYYFLAVADWQPEDLADLVLEIIPKTVADKVITQINSIPGLAPVDVSRGIIAGGVEALMDEESDDFQAAAGVTVTCAKFLTGETIEAVTVYMNDKGQFDPALQATSSEGQYIIYNIPIDERGFTNVSLRADKEEFVFMFIPHARAYPYRASPEKATIVPFEGFKIIQAGDTSTDGDGGSGGGGG
jgi:hypothetical protein